MNKSLSGGASVTIPPTAAGGTFYLLACADDGAAVTELNETNNCRASSKTVHVN